MIYPQQRFEYFTSAGRKDNTLVTFVNILCYPVQYYPQQQIISYCTNIEITINYMSPQQDLIYNDDFDLVIISPGEFTSELQPLITHKNNMGVKTFLKTTEEIYDEYSGEDKPE